MGQFRTPRRTLHHRTRRFPHWRPVADAWRNDYQPLPQTPRLPTLRHPVNPHVFLHRNGILSNTWKRNRSGIQPVHNQRSGKLYTSIYYSGSINHSGTAKELDSQAQITCQSLWHPEFVSFRMTQLLPSHQGESYKFYFTSAIRLHTSDIFQPYFACEVNQSFRNDH